MITENLSSGTKCIPETIIISVPNSKDALLKCIESSNSRAKKYINSLRSSLRGDSSNALCKEDEIITYMYINPVNKSFYELIKKKSTSSNSLLSKLTNSYWENSLSPIELKNEGWRIERVLIKSEVIDTSCRNTLQGNSYIDDNDNYLIMVLSHPEMRNTIYSKFGYDINEYPNLCTVVLVDNNFLSDYLNTFNKSFVYGNSFDTVRIVDCVVKDKTCPGSNISAKTEFISEDYYKVNTKKLDYAIKLGNVESNLVSLNNKYIPGHIYRFQGNSNAFELLSASYYYRGRSHYLLYIGKIDLARYISTSHYRLMIQGLFTDIYDMSELNDWSKDLKNLTKLGGNVPEYGCTNVNMCFNTPVDVFTIVGVEDNYYGEDKCLPETQKSEDEYLDLLTNKFNTSIIGTEEVKNIRGARFVVLPAIELTNNKRGHSLEIEVTPDSEKTRMKTRLSEKDLPTSYRIYQDVVDLGKYVDIISPTKIFMKKVILSIEGKNGKNTYDLLKSLTKNLNSGGWGSIGTGAINLDSYNLLTKEELLTLDKETFNNLRSNLMDLIVKVLYAYCTVYAQSCFCNTYRKSFTMNVFSPKFSDIKEGFLLRLQNSIYAHWTGQKDRSSNAIYSSSFKSLIEDIIITELGKGKQEGDLTYNATGIFDTLEKYCITEKDLRQCTEFLN